MWICHNIKYAEHFANETRPPAHGFVYLITNLTNNMKYVGKKSFSGGTHWPKYYGSSKALLADVKRLGRQHFQREVLHVCQNKGTLSYWETYEIMVRHALIDDSYYNQTIFRVTLSAHHM